MPAPARRRKPPGSRAGSRSQSVHVAASSASSRMRAAGRVERGTCAEFPRAAATKPRSWRAAPTCQRSRTPGDGVASGTSISNSGATPVTSSARITIADGHRSTTVPPSREPSTGRAQRLDSRRVDERHLGEVDHGARPSGKGRPCLSPPVGGPGVRRRARTRRGVAALVVAMRSPPGGDRGHDREAPPVLVVRARDPRRGGPGGRHVGDGHPHAAAASFDLEHDGPRSVEHGVGDELAHQQVALVDQPTERPVAADPLAVPTSVRRCADVLRELHRRLRHRLLHTRSWYPAVATVMRGRGQRLGASRGLGGTDEGNPRASTVQRRHTWETSSTR